MKNNLKIYQRIHSGVRSFLCVECSKSFCDPGILKTHQNIHSGVQPFSCDMCNKSFTIKSSLKTSVHTQGRVAILM
jgi:KRAB domain-containing zinc finger protein